MPQSAQSSNFRQSRFRWTDPTFYPTDINLSLDDKWLYVSCWSTGELRRYDVSVPDHPKLASVIQIGGIVRRAPHPKEPDVALNGGPQMVEISRMVSALILPTRSMHPGSRMDH